MKQQKVKLTVTTELVLNVAVYDPALITGPISGAIKKQLADLEDSISEIEKATLKEIVAGLTY